MSLIDQIPQDFYRIFGTKNREHYLWILKEIYEEHTRGYAAFGLTAPECRQVIEQAMHRRKMLWEREDEEELEREQQSQGFKMSASTVLQTLTRWGWIVQEYDDRLDEYLITFPEYSQLFLDILGRLYQQDSEMERQSILAVYSALYTYQMDRDRNKDFLRAALRSARGLSHMLGSMQEGMYRYFEKLSASGSFLEIQQILIEEINNQSSRQYAILTTTDSFYRYKESIREMISMIYAQNDERREELERGRSQCDPGKAEVEYRRYELLLQSCQESAHLLSFLEREFDQIEKKYNRLIELKTSFAKRALARIHYRLQEGTGDADNLLSLIRMISTGPRGNEVLERLAGRMQFSQRYLQMSEQSFYKRRKQGEPEYMEVEIASEESAEMDDFVPEPMYTKSEIRAFKQENTRDGRFEITPEKIRSVEDLEKLLFLWQEETGSSQSTSRIELGEEMDAADGMRFTRICIEEEEA